MYGSIEAGGTKFVCAVGNDELEIIDLVRFPTTSPEETMEQVLKFFRGYEQELSGIAIGSFGPIDVTVDSPTYGYITSTPKKAWANFDFVGTLKEHFNFPIHWTTDVNASAYGEYTAGSSQGLASIVYFTIGTGIGGGAIQDGHFIQGHSHPEMGHILVRKHPKDTFSGICPYHADCLEGLACGPAIEERLGTKGQNISAEDSFWEIEASYLAQAAYTSTLQLSPQKIIFGGGVMKQQGLIDKVRAEFTKLMNDYLPLPPMEEYICTPSLGDEAGTIGCLALAKDNEEQKV